MKSHAPQKRPGPTFAQATAHYAAFGVNVEAALARLSRIPMLPMVSRSRTRIKEFANSGSNTARPAARLARPWERLSARPASRMFGFRMDTRTHLPIEDCLANDSLRPWMRFLRSRFLEN